MFLCQELWQVLCQEFIEFDENSENDDLYDFFEFLDFGSNLDAIIEYFESKEYDSGIGTDYILKNKKIDHSVIF